MLAMANVLQKPMCTLLTVTGSGWFNLKTDLHILFKHIKFLLPIQYLNFASQSRLNDPLIYLFIYIYLYFTYEIKKNSQATEMHREEKTKNNNQEKR